MNRPLLLALVLGAAACGYRSSPSQPPTPDVKSVSLSPANPTLSVGQTVQLIATPYDSHGQPVSGLTVAWTSGAPSIASVDSTGLVHGLAAGDTQISASVEGANAALTVTVNQ
jgi:uncharacterized protein YjdB